VIKASAGVAFHAPVLRSATAEQACATLRAVGFAVLGLSSSAPGATSLFGDPPPARVVYVLGNETSGISPAVAAQLTGWVGIPMAGDVESLNVASAAAVVCFDWARRRAEGSYGGLRAHTAASVPGILEAAEKYRSKPGVH
jgi:23S rRNA (guanosine2251-2'-O)-methyltransferase